jgi:hypothetical protein
VPDELSRPLRPSPLAPPPPATSGAAVAPARQRLDPRLRALLLSFIVLAAGAVLGAGGFLVEQTRATWPPQVTADGDGWRVTTSHGLRLGDAALGGDQLVWEAGAFTLVTDLTTGKSKLLGAAAYAGTASAPSASSRYAAWMEGRHGEGREPVVWVFDMASRRRTRLDGTEGITRSPALAGSVAVWAAAHGDSWLVRGVDLATGRRLRVAETAVADDLSAAGDLAAWVSRRAAGSEPPVITVADLTDSLRRFVAPYQAGEGGRLIGFALAGRSLVWARSSGGGVDQVVAFNVDSGSTRVLAAWPGVRALAAAGDLVVWAQGAPDGQVRVMGMRAGTGAPYVSLAASEEPFLIGEAGAGLTDVYAGADIAAWRVQSALLFDSYLRTVEVR